MLKIHKVQTYIMRCLTEIDSARFEELRPKDVPANLFAYHLKTLLLAGIIEKDDKNYRLTEKGGKYVEGISLFDSSIKIKTSVLVENNNGEKRLVSTELTPEDARIADAATRVTQKKLSQKKLSKLQHVGDAYIKLMDAKGRILASDLHHIFSAKTNHALAEVPNDLPDAVVEEVIFARDKSDGHFFFERSYYF
jgi:hypothetical protein